MYIFAFRSRNQSMRFYEMLKKEGIYSKLISTPRSVAVGCGLSVQITQNNIENAKRIFYGSNFDTFLGFFSLSGSSAYRISL